MSKTKRDPLLEALEEGRSYTWSVPDGGNLASMRKAIQHGQTLTMSPISDPAEIQVGDMVLVRWHQSYIFHLVGEIQDGRYLIVNSLGGVNGWVEADAILGRVTKVVEPEPRPDLEAMFKLLETSHEKLIALDRPGEYEAGRLYSIVKDLRWYAGRIRAERCTVMPRSNKWSFEQNLWHLTKQVRDGAAPVAERVLYFIDQGKQAVGLAAEIFELFEYNDTDQ